MKTDLTESRSHQLEGSKVDGRVALSLKRSVTWENCDSLRKKLQKKIDAGHTEIILDLKRVEHLDSAALELLIEMHDVLMKQGGALKIVGLNEVCRDILLATRIINILFVYKDINEAIARKKL
jgi:anti-anti-sigma factor